MGAVSISFKKRQWQHIEHIFQLLNCLNILICLLENNELSYLKLKSNFQQQNFIMNKAHFHRCLQELYDISKDNDNE